MSSLRTFSPFLLCAIAVILSSSLHIVASVCRESDKAALLRIKSSFGYNSRMATWDNSTDCCYYWFGVTCEIPAGKVIHLWITDSNTSGPLPSSIGDLPDLKLLGIVNHPNLTGPIPKSITKLRNLEGLAITGTSLSGKIPTFLCNNMANMYSLDLSNNSLSGKIPSCFTGRVHDINLSQNRLSGHLPASLFKDYVGNDVLAFNVQGNQLGGKIPQSFRTVNFQYLDLSDNQLRGDASVLFGESKVLDRINLSNNKFDFDLSRVAYPLYMSWLNISHNKIRGSINPQITKLQRLGGVDMSYNRLCGPIPSGLKAYDQSAFAHNKCLCGTPLPPCEAPDVRQ